jgi:uncharacterized protein YegP (UPF0339 family)
MAAKYELKKGADGKFRFNLKAGNGEIILSSEAYNAKASALNGIESVKTNSPLDERYERKEAKNGEGYFVLLAANKEIVGRSETYKSAASMEKGIESVKKNGPAAEVVDLTA